MSADRIEKSVVLAAPRPAVWRALTRAEEFSAWFGATMTGPFVPGATVTGRITYPGYEHLTMTMVIERVEPEHLFSYRWHPNAIDPEANYSDEPMTLVEFRLTEVAGGTQLTVVESGFDGIPLARREQAFRENDGGWTEQMSNITRYLANGAPEAR